MQSLISLVSGTYNRIDLLKSMVQSFRDNLLPGIPYEVVLVDGGSTDGTIEWCKTQRDIRLIEDGTLYGAISAFTRGAKAAQGKYILLSNDDVTFFNSSILPAIVYLENNLTCGAVAFQDNRPMGDGRGRDVYKTNAVRGIRDGNFVTLTYAQVGLFRKWLGDKLNWWLGEHDEMQGAQVYGGDNSLSAQIWSYGYSVDEVQGCKVEDHIANDELRQINYQKGIESNDSHFFFEQYDWTAGGIVVPSEPQLPQQDKRAARILYLPIYEPGWEIQKHPIHGKHGLREALARAKNKYGVNHIVQEYDYLAANPTSIRHELLELVDSFKPDLILTQIQAHLPITATLLSEVRQRSNASIINWNGDQAVGGLYSKELLPILKQIDLQLITNLDVVPDYEREGIKWDYWQIGYEMPEGDIEENVRSYFQEIGRGNPFEQDRRDYPVVYLATLRTAERNAIARVVEEFGGLVEQPGDTHATLYNFSTSTLLYRRSKVIISDNGFNSRGFVSNRLFQALASTGGVVLQQHVEGLDELTGLVADYHYIEWFDLEHLKEMLSGVLNADDSKMIPQIAQRGTEFVRENFSFDAQVAKLMQLIKKHLGESEQLANSIALKYIGRNTSSFGLGNMFPSGQRYEYIVGKNLYVKREDLDMLMGLYPNDWERLEIE